MKYSRKMDQIMISELLWKYKLEPETLIQNEERVFHEKLTNICDHVLQKKINIILLTGPSASGKTTTAKRLVTELLLRGIKSNRISLDNFYRNNDEDPLWEDGQPNYESIRSLDVNCFHQKMYELFRYGGSDFPVFDFDCGRRSSEAFSVSFDQDTCLIFEGIHALNPLLSGHILEKHTMRLYVSVHSDFVNDSGMPVLAAQNLRFLRRMLRDYAHRSDSAEETMKMWKHVLEGEKLYIQPYRRYADFHINTVHSYEPFLYQEKAMTLLRPLMDNTEFLQLAGQLIAAETLFPPLSAARVPKSSLLQEFI